MVDSKSPRTRGFGIDHLDSARGGRFLTVTNAANHQRDLARFREHAGDFDAEVRDAAADYAMLAVQGPEARGIVGALAAAPLPPRMRCEPLELAGADALVCGTGY